MLEFLSRNWWVLVARGVAALIFGVLAFVWPGATLAVLVLMWGAFALVDGVMALIGALRRRDAGFPWWLLVIGIAGIAAGLVTFANPAITAVTLLWLIAAFAIVRGVMTIAAAIRLRREIRNEWVLGLEGLAALAFGVLVLFFPVAGALAIVLWIAAMAIIVGVLEIALGLRLRNRAPGAGGRVQPT